jgi:hypothetical protein
MTRPVDPLVEEAAAFQEQQQPCREGVDRVILGAAQHTHHVTQTVDGQVLAVTRKVAQSTLPTDRHELCLQDDLLDVAEPPF